MHVPLHHNLGQTIVTLTPTQSSSQIVQTQQIPGQQITITPQPQITVPAVQALPELRSQLAPLPGEGSRPRPVDITPQEPFITPTIVVGAVILALVLWGLK